jgi:transposase-like protein
VGGRRYAPLGDVAWLRQRYLDEGLSFAEIAREVGSHESAVRAAATAAGIPRRPRARQRRYRQLNDRAWLRQRYVVELATTRDIAREVGCSPRAALSALSAAGIARQVRRSRDEPYRRLGESGWLQERYVSGAASVRDIAGEVGCNQRTVRRALAAAGIARRGPSRRHRRLGDRDWLRLRYLEQRVSVADIAAELGCHQSAVYKALEAAGIPRGGRTRPPRRFTQLGDHAWLRRRYDGVPA